ncbi:MAG: hypothetical protein WDO15_16855 [Bacteroidota bacterium]
MKFITIVFLSISTITLSAQNINWANLRDNEKHFVSATTGLDYGLIFGAGYGQRLNTKIPLIISGDYSQPAGKVVFDDLKTRVGAQAMLLKLNNFRFTAKIYGVFRLFNNEVVRLSNFGTDMSGVIGYYRPRWFVATEIGFDKAIATHVRHTQAYKNDFPGAVGGWYQPATGGNFNYGLLGGLSLGRADLSLAVGRVVTQDFKSTPFIPFYVKIGVAFKF